jgi:hypothetical protein
MLIVSHTGSETFPSGSAKSFTFVVPTRRHPGKEVHIGIACKERRQGFNQSGAPEFIPIAPGYKRELGVWTRCTYDVPEGTVLKIFAQRSGGFGEMRIQGQILIQLRAQAAYRRIGSVLTGNEKANLRHANTEGRFDILTLDDAERLGIDIPYHFRPAFDPSMVRRAFQITELEAAITPPVQVQTQQVTNSQGETVRVQTGRRVRALDL